MDFLGVQSVDTVGRCTWVLYCSLQLLPLFTRVQTCEAPFAWVPSILFFSATALNSQGRKHVKPITWVPLVLSKALSGACYQNKGPTQGRAEHDPNFVNALP
jgi:hypothetical protein